MTKVQEEVVAVLFTTYKEKLQDLMNSDGTAAQEMVERGVDELQKLFQAKGIAIKLPAR